MTAWEQPDNVMYPNSTDTNSTAFSMSLEFFMPEQLIHEDVMFHDVVGAMYEVVNVFRTEANYTGTQLLFLYIV